MTSMVCTWLPLLHLPFHWACPIYSMLVLHPLHYLCCLSSRIHCCCFSVDDAYSSSSRCVLKLLGFLKLLLFTFSFLDRLSLFSMSSPWPVFIRQVFDRMSSPMIFDAVDAPLCWRARLFMKLFWYELYFRLLSLLVLDSRSLSLSLKCSPVVTVLYPTVWSSPSVGPISAGCKSSWVCESDAFSLMLVSIDDLELCVLACWVVCGGWKR